MRRHLSLGPTLVLLFVGAAIAAVAAGLWLVDPPWRERAQQIDARRSQNLESLHWAIQGYFQDHGSLPRSLDELDPQWERLRHDPETGAEVEYRVTGERQYEICAVFAEEAEIEDPVWQTGFYQHPAGRACFERTVDLPA